MLVRKLPVTQGNRVLTFISTRPLAPANEFLKKGLSGKYTLVFT